MTVAPRTLVHRGVLSVDALWIDVPTVGEAAARARVLALWAHGPTVRGGPGGWLVRLRRPVSLPVEEAPGQPLVRARDVFLGLPLADDEWPHPLPPPGSVLRARAGALVATPASALPPIDPADWLDVSDLEPVDARGLGAPPRPVVAATGPGREALREAAGVAAEEARLAQVEGDALAAVLAGESPSGGGPGDGPLLPARRPSGPSPLTLGLARALGRVAHGLQRMAFGGRETARPPNALDRLAAWVDDWLERSALGDRLAQLAGRRHADYLRQLLDEFDNGDLDAALRRALPLTDEGGLARRSLRLQPPNRDALTPGLTPASGRRSSVQLGQDLFAHLRALYRKAFEKLDQDGRVTEAAFVLADLLGRPEEAVAYLESKGALRLAAQLAEARALDPALAIRLWLAAGEVTGATRVARLRGAWAAAVTALSKSHPDLATQLRAQWVTHLVARGDPAGALEVVGDLPVPQDVQDTWIAAARRQGGGAWARVTALQLARWPARLTTLWPEIAAVLDDPTPTGASTRRRLGDALAHHEGPAVQQVAGRVARQLLVDRNTVAGIPDSLLQRLADHAGDGALMADLPRSLPRPARPAAPEHGWAATDRGTRPAHDAAWLDDGTLLIALGERGVERRDPSGRLLHHHPAPAWQLVLRGGAGRALAMAPRGPERTDMALLDLDSGETTALDPLPGGAGAPWYDGGLWVHRAGRTLRALDVTGVRTAGWKALWSLDLGDLVPLSFRWTPAALYALCIGDPGMELWRWSLPGFTLRDRTPLPGVMDTKAAVGTLAMPVFRTTEGALVGCGQRGVVAQTIAPHVGPHATVVVTDDFAAALTVPPDGPPRVTGWALSGALAPRTVCLLRRTGPDAPAHVARPVTLRLRADGLLCVADRAGRVAAFDAAAGAMLADVRL